MSFWHGALFNKVSLAMVSLAMVSLAMVSLAGCLGS